MSLPDSIEEAIAWQRELDDATRRLDALHSQKPLCWIAIVFGLALLPFGSIAGIPIVSGAFWLWNIHRTEPELRNRIDNLRAISASSRRRAEEKYT